MSDTPNVSIDETMVDDFESAWLTGNPRPIEEFVPPQNTPAFLPTLEELVHVELELAWRTYRTDTKGKGDETTATPNKVENYLKRFPELTTPSILARLVLQEHRVRCKYAIPPSKQEYRERFPDVELSDTQLATVDPASLGVHKADAETLKPGGNIGRYSIVDEQGRGGFGCVWQVDDPKLERRVALKQINERLTSQKDLRRRFVLEARTAARLEHPGVVPVYDLGQLDETQPYYTMKLVKGRTLDEAMREFDDKRQTSSASNVDQQRLLGAFLSICRTMEYVHAHGVVHRDLKPQNIVLGDFGETIILDWGLAKGTADRDDPTDRTHASSESGVEDDALTREGTVQGTPAYMSPEQAGGRTKYIDHQSDIYSLGVILYQLLTGQLPFQGLSGTDLLCALQDSEPPRPRSLSKSIPRPLEAICLKAMAKTRSRRYREVGDLVKDLDRYLADEPVSVYEEPTVERLWRWVRRNRSWTVAAAMALLMITVVSVIALVAVNAARAKAAELAEEKTELAIEENKARRNAEEQQRIADQRRREVERFTELSANLGLMQAETNLDHMNFRMVVLWLAQSLQIALPAHQDIQHMVRSNLNFLSTRFHPLRGVLEHDGPIHKMIVSSDGKRLMTLVERGAHNSEVWLWNLDVDNPQAMRLDHNHVVTEILFLPDGKLAVTTCKDGTVRFWQVSTAEPAGAPLEHPSGVRLAVASPDGKFLFTVCDDRTLRRWSVETRKQDWASPQHKAPIGICRLSPDGATILTVVQSVEVRQSVARLWDSASGNPLCEPIRTVPDILCAAFSPDSSTFVAGMNDLKIDATTLTEGGIAEVKAWDARSGEPRGEPFTHKRAVTAVAFSADGKLLISRTLDGLVHFWSVAGRKLRRSERLGAASCDDLRISPDGGLYAAATGSQAVVLGEVRTTQIMGEHLLQNSNVTAIAFGPSSESVWVAGLDGSVTFWEIMPSHEVWRRLPHKGVRFARFSNEEHTVITADHRDVCVWDVKESPASLQSEYALFSESSELEDIYVLSSRGKFAVSCTSKNARLWNVADRSPIGDPLVHRERVKFAEFSPHGDTVLTVAGGTAFCWETSTAQTLGRPMEHGDDIVAAVLSGDGKILLTAGGDGKVLAWRVQSGERVGAFLHSHVSGLACTSNGERVYTDDGALLRCWDLESGNVIWQVDLPAWRFEFPPAPRMSRYRSRDDTVDLSRDGSLVLVKCLDMTSRIWNTETRELTTQVPIESLEVQTSFSPEHEFVFVSNALRMGNTYHIATNQSVFWPIIFNDEGLIRDCGFSPKGDRLMVADRSWGVKVMSIPRPLEGEADRIALWAQTLAFNELDDKGMWRELDLATWREREQELQETGGPPNTMFGKPPRRFFYVKTPDSVESRK